MTETNFYSKLSDTVAKNDSLLCVGLDPSLERLPARYRNGGEPARDILQWHQATIDATADIVCAYKPNIAFYEAMGDAGYWLLQQTLQYIPSHIPVILDVKRGDIASTATAYAQACFEQWQVDAITASPFLGLDSLAPFLSYADKGIFALCHTSNPGAVDFQELEINDWRTLDREPNQPLFIHIARKCTSFSERISLVVSATFPETIAQVRSVAPETWFLIPGVGSQTGDLEAAVRAGLRADRSGIVLNVSRSVTMADDIRQVALDYRNRINAVRKEAPQSPQTDRMAGLGRPAEHMPAHRQLATGLVDCGAIKFGEFTLSSGKRSSYYTDMRLLISDPPLLARAATAYARELDDIVCDRLAGVPYGGLPIATALALQNNVPLIYPRKEAKSHGTARRIEGKWNAGERVVVIEDVITSGGSLLQAAELLREAGLVVEDAIVLLDREEGAVAALHKAGIRVHAVLTTSQLVNTLVQDDLLPEEMASVILSNVTGAGAA